MNTANPKRAETAKFGAPAKNDAVANWLQRAWTGYAVAVCAVALGLLLRVTLTALLGEGLPRYITFFPAVVVAALLGGRGPGLVATTVAELSADIWVGPPRGLLIHLTPVETAGSLLFLGMGTFLTELTVRYRNARQRAAAFEKELVLRESQEELRRQREWLRVTLSSIGEAVLATDTTGRITLLNPAGQRLTGWTEKEALGQPVANILRLVDERTRAPVEDPVAAVLRDRRIVSDPLHTSLIARDGREISVEHSAAPILETSDTTSGVVLVLQDVTEKRHAHKAVLQERDFVSSLIDTAGALFVVFDRDGRIQRFNRACENLSGYRLDEVKGKHVWDFLLPPEEVEPVKGVFAELQAGHFPNRYENDWVARSGDRRRISWTRTCILGEDGQVRCIAGVGIDVTQQRLAEAAYHKTAEMHRLALGAGDLGTWNYDFTTRDVFWDERCRNLFGMSRGDRIAYEKVIDIVHEADRKDVDQAVRAALAPGSTGAYEREYRVVWPDGAEHWVEAKGQVYFQGEGNERKPVRFIGTVRDITERHHTKETLAFLAQCGSSSGENFFQSLARFLAKTLSLDYALIYRLDGGVTAAKTVAIFHDAMFLEDVSHTLDDTPGGAVLDQTFCCFPSGVRSRFPKDRMLQDMQAESYAGVALRGHTGNPVGLIALVGRGPLANPGLAESLLHLVAGRAAGELERQQVDHALRKNQERLLLAQRAGHVGVFDLDFRSNHTFWSDERKALFGVPQDFHPESGSWTKLVHPADRNSMQADLQRAFAAQRREVNQTFRITLPEGQQRWLEDRALVTYDGEGRAVRMVGTTRDITAELHARQRARRGQRQLTYSAIRTVTVLALALFAAEAGIMVALTKFPLLSAWWGVAFDSVGLVVLVSPVLYYFAFRPLVAMLQQREQDADALRRTNDTLESRVKDRTASLELANQKLEAEVVERNKAEAEVRRAKEEWERTFDAVPDLIAILDDRFRVKRANRAMTERLGISPDHYGEKPCHELVHGLGCPPNACPHKRTLADGREHTCEVSEPRLGGDFLITTSPLLDENHHQIGSVHVARDITARKRAEEALRQSREDLNHAQAVAHVGSWRLNVQRNELLWSEEAWRIFGLPRETPLNYETFLGTIYPADHNYVHARWMAALRGEPYDIEHRIVVGDKIKWVREQAELEFDAEGMLLGGFGTTQDITERKQAEEALAQANERLEQEVLARTATLRETNEKLRSEIRIREETEQRIKEAELRYRTVADFTHDWEYWLSPTGSLLYCSPSCERITGWTAGELIASPNLLDQIVHPEDHRAWTEHERGALAETHHKTTQFRIVCKDGATRWIEHVCIRVVGPNGEHLGVRASNRDITDRQRAEMEMQGLRTELSRVSRITMTGQMAAAIAHELNQPLGAILCNAQSAITLLDRQDPDLAEALETLNDIQSDSQRAGAIIHHLRSLYQQRGRSIAPLQLNEVAQNTLTLLNSEFVLKGVTVRLDLSPSLPRIHGNATELQQVILNLVLNAVDAMASCSPGNRQLHLSTSEDAEFVRCTTADSGPGIPDEKLARLFQPFFTTKSKGMGMGLAITRSIVEAHGGRLWAENNPTGGASFQFALPKSHSHGHTSPQNRLA